MNIGVLVSGGVDSSVALALTKEQYPESKITAFYLKIWLEDELSFLGQCPWEDDLKNVRNVCELLDIPLEIVSLQTVYQEKVVEYVTKELKLGRTPSPDLLCNQFIKFGAFFDLTINNSQTSLDLVVTGHYANAIRSNDKVYLSKAKDLIKDQTYFLSLLDQNQLSKCYFPLGRFLKSEVRELAQVFNLPNAQRPDSQGICFLGKIPYDEFVKYHLGTRAGNIIDLDTQKVIGTHQGYWFHTIGQRKGLGLSGGPWFVADKNISDNIVYVRHINSTDNQGYNTFLATTLNWLAPAASDKKNFNPNITNQTDDPLLSVKLRHGPTTLECKINNLENRSSNFENLEIYLTKSSDRGIAPGQFAVFYQQDLCIGAAVIDKIL